MHRDWLSHLRCPVTGEPLRLEATVEVREEIEEGRLVAASGTEYPIVRGIPRFARPPPGVASFAFEWRRWPRVQFEAENVGGPMAGHTMRMWERVTGLDSDRLDGRVVAEFGCGAGRFLDVVRRKGGRAIGIELSDAVEAARANFADDPDVLVVQADLFAPPLEPSLIDGSFSIGVLHHTPDPARGVAAMARATRPEGWVGVLVYPRGEFYDWPSVRRHRRWNAALRPLLGYLPPLVYSHIAAYGLYWAVRGSYRVRGAGRLANWAMREWLPVISLPDARWRVLDVFDAVTPSVASTHTREELFQWFAGAGLHDVRATDWGSTAAVGLKA